MIAYSLHFRLKQNKLSVAHSCAALKPEDVDSVRNLARIEPDCVDAGTPHALLECEDLCAENIEHFETDKLVAGNDILDHYPCVVGTRALLDQTGLANRAPVRRPGISGGNGSQAAEQENRKSARPNS